jgi:DNA-binding Lrp family transcriptional regulator
VSRSPGAGRSPGAEPFAYDTGEPANEGVDVVSAYILIQTEVGRASHVTREIGGIDGIVQVDGVTGPYDVIARGEAADLDELAKAIVMPIQSVEGVTRTLTCPVLQF